MNNIDKYFQRIALRLPLSGDKFEVLKLIHASHLSHIPFENLSIFLGEKISLKTEDLVKKLIDEKRGGYCFENNLLSYEILKHLGYNVKLLGARVLLGGQIMAMTHLVLQVELDGSKWLYDVGFGGNGIRFPQNFDGRIQDQQFFDVRLCDVGTQWILEKRHKNMNDWIPLYAIQKIDYYPLDCEVANYYTSTNPESIFKKTITVQKFFPMCRIIYRKSKVLEKTLLTLGGETLGQVTVDEVVRDISENFGYSKSFLSGIEKAFKY